MARPWMESRIKTTVTGLKEICRVAMDAGNERREGVNVWKKTKTKKMILMTVNDYFRSCSIVAKWIQSITPNSRGLPAERRRNMTDGWTDGR